MNDNLISREAFPENINKIKVSRAEIVVHGTKEKPYYEIAYFDLFDNEMHIGYGSYNLDIVFGYLEEYFDILDKKSEHGKRENPITGDLISRNNLLGTESLLMTDIVENNEVAKYILEQVLYDIEHAPTAFDRQKVIKEIEYNREMSKKYSTGLREEGHIEAFNEAIPIIKKGRVE